MHSSWNNNNNYISQKITITITMEDSNSSCSSLSSSSTISLDFMDNESSSSSSLSLSSSSSSPSDGPLFQLSDLMDQLPIKRGLSKCYEGKSQSFASLASVESLEDLAKGHKPYKKRVKFCNNVQKHLSPKASITKKTSNYKGTINNSTYSSSNLMRNCSQNFMSTCRFDPISLHKEDF